MEADRRTRRNVTRRRTEGLQQSNGENAQTSNRRIAGIRTRSARHLATNLLATRRGRKHESGRLHTESN